MYVSLYLFSKFGFLHNGGLPLGVQRGGVPFSSVQSPLHPLHVISQSLKSVCVCVCIYGLVFSIATYTYKTGLSGNHISTISVIL